MSVQRGKAFQSIVGVSVRIEHASLAPRVDDSLPDSENGLAFPILFACGLLAADV